MIIIMKLIIIIIIIITIITNMIQQTSKYLINEYPLSYTQHQPPKPSFLPSELTRETCGDRLTDHSLRYSGHLQGICFSSEHRHAAMLWIPVDEIPFPWPRRTRLDVTYHIAQSDFAMIDARLFFRFQSFSYFLLYIFFLIFFFPFHNQCWKLSKFPHLFSRTVLRDAVLS